MVVIYYGTKIANHIQFRAPAKNKHYKYCFKKYVLHICISDKMRETVESLLIMAKIILRIASFFWGMFILYFSRFSRLISSIFPDHFCVKFLGKELTM